MQVIGEFFITFLLNAVWQAALLTLVAVGCTRLLRAVSVRYRYLLWVAVLGLSLVLPVATSLWVSWPDLFEPGVASVIPAELATASELPNIALAQPLPVEVPIPNPFDLALPMSVAVGIFALYASFVLYRSWSLLRAWLRTRKLARGARAAELSEHILAAVAKCRAVIGKTPVHIRFSNQIPVPVTVGCRDPLVILPEHFLREIDADVLVTALGHEIVHVARRDYIVNLALEIICLPLSFHPAVVYAKLRIDHLRELCCDETVATRLLEAEVYARSLLNIAGSAHGLSRLSPIITVGITDAENLEVRIMSLLKRSEMSWYKKSFLTVAAIVLLAIPLAVAGFVTPDVTLNTAPAQPVAQPTVPPNEREDAFANERRAALERELAELKNRQQRPDLTEEERRKLGEKERAVARKLEAVDRSEKQIQKMVEIRKALEDPSLPESRQKQLIQIEQKIALDLKLSGAEVIVDISLDDPKREHEEWFPNGELDRAEKQKLAKAANITMDQAVEIALASRPGKLFEKEIGQMKGEVIYRILIRDVPETTDGAGAMVIVSGMDGRIVHTEKVKVRKFVMN